MSFASIRSALDDGTMEQALARRHRHHGRDFAATAGLPEDRDVAGVTAKFGDVVAYPLQRGDEIEHAGVACVSELGCDFGQIKETECVEPMIERDDNHVASLGKPCAVIFAFRAGQDRISAAVK